MKSFSKLSILSILVAYLNFADLEGLLILISFMLGVIAFFDISLNNLLLLFCNGKYLDIFLSSERLLKKYLIILSSNEWNETYRIIHSVSKILVEFIKP